MRLFHFLTAILVAVSLMLSSCKAIKQELKTSRLRKENHLFSYSALKNPSNDTTPIPKTYISTKQSHAQVKVKEDNDGLFITIQNKSEVEGLGRDQSKFKIKYLSDAVNAPDLSFSPIKGATRPPEFFFNSSDAKRHFGFADDVFRYRQLRPYIQALTVAVKFRSKIDADLNNNLPAAPAQIESGSGVATIALATGLKHSWSKYTGSKNALGFSTISHSLATGVLVGLSAADLKASTTRGQVTGANVESKNLIIPVGLHLVYGYNNINLGVAVGKDIITGPNRTKWNYFDRTWWAIIVGIDIVK